MKIELQLRSLRRRRGWRLRDLASKVGLSTSDLSKVERGISNLNDDLIARLADAFGIAPIELFGSDEEAQIMYLWARLDPEDRLRVTRFATELAHARNVARHD